MPCRNEHLELPSVLLDLLEEAEAKKGAGEMQETEHRGGLAIEAHSEAAVGQHPRLRPFWTAPVEDQRREAHALAVAARDLLA